MQKILSTTAKELLLLVRDRAGLLVLFIMPAILVIVITLVQENILALSGQRQTEVLLLDQDGGVFASTLLSSLRQMKISVHSPEQGEDLQRLIADGRYQAGIIIPAGVSRRLQQEMASRLAAGDHAIDGTPDTASLSILFDPGAMAGFRAGILSRLQMAARAAEIEMLAQELGHSLQARLGRLNPGAPSPLQADDSLKQTFSHSFTTITEQPTTTGTATISDIINPVNQNVPAWALFGMFFTAIPIAGTILAERRSGIAVRLAGIPVSPLQLLGGKITAYLCVCLCQFLLIVLIGIVLFPHLGLQAFTLPENPMVLLPLICACSLAACGFGTFLGSVCHSYEQASTLGSTMVVIAAALGGVMVPVYAMPQMMQRLSILSPLNWGVNAFLDLLVRGKDFLAIGHDLARLLTFFAVMVILSWKRSSR
ncbi:MAG: ABC transporter permease [Desulfocapsaceae bacterium]|nr:ABC transporter permease [Desulfocapsaceae bacterium]